MPRDEELKPQDICLSLLASRTISTCLPVQLNWKHVYLVESRKIILEVINFWKNTINLSECEISKDFNRFFAPDEV